MARRLILEPGQRFGLLMVICLHERTANGSYWKVRCDCGNETIARGSALNNGYTISCKCRMRRTAAERCMKHGYASRDHSKRHELYASWVAILARCETPSHKNYGTYGGRGIHVCERWHDFTKFVDDMGPRPSRSHSIDRIDNNGNYEPGNCRWATYAQQSRNTRRNIWVSHNGETLTMTDWANKHNLSVPTLKARLKRGWPIERALTTPCSTPS